jgi:heat shock protein HspQ
MPKLGQQVKHCLSPFVGVVVSVTTYLEPKRPLFGVQPNVIEQGRPGPVSYFEECELEVVGSSDEAGD